MAVAKVPRWFSVWLIISAALMLWDASYVLLRPRSIAPYGDLSWLFKPYIEYAKVDKLYSREALESGDGFCAAQSMMNVVEVVLQLTTVVLWSQKKALGDLVGFACQLMTLWKTVLYLLTDAVAGFKTTDVSQLQPLIMFFIIPNSFWIICPAIIVTKLGGRIASLLQLANGKKAR